MAFQIKVTRSLLALLITMVNAGGAFAGILIQTYVQNSTVSGGAYLFISTISNALIVYLTTEEQQVKE